MKILLDIPEETVIKFEGFAKTEKRSRKACMELALIEYNRNGIISNLKQSAPIFTYNQKELEKELEQSLGINQKPIPEKKIPIKNKTAQDWITEKREIPDGNMEAYREWLADLDASGLSSKVKTEIKFA